MDQGKITYTPTSPSLLIPTPSLTQLMLIGDGDQSPCLVTSHADEHKRPVHIYMHTPPAVFKNIQNIKYLLYQIKYRNTTIKLEAVIKAKGGNTKY